jgi:pyruvate kinase
MKFPLLLKWLIELVESAKNRKILKNGEKIIITAGVPFGKVGTTNTLRIAKIIANNKLT